MNSFTVPNKPQEHSLNSLELDQPSIPGPIDTPEIVPVKKSHKKMYMAIAALVVIGGVVGGSAYALSKGSFDVRQQASTGSGPCEPNEKMVHGICVPITPPVNMGGSTQGSASPVPTPPMHNPPPVFETTSLPNGEVGKRYSAYVYATDQNQILFSLSGFPGGLSITGCTGGVNTSNHTSRYGCEISGTPTKECQVNAIVRALDEQGAVTDKSFPLTIEPKGGANAAPTFGTVNLPQGSVGKGYSGSVVGWDTDLGDALTLTADNLPAGVRVSGCGNTTKDGKTQATCKIGGTPKTSGQFGVTLQFTDKKGKTATKNATITIKAAGINID